MPLADMMVAVVFIALLVVGIIGLVDYLRRR